MRDAVRAAARAILRPMTAPGALTADYDFTLPPELIAQSPPAERGTSRLMLVDRTLGTDLACTIRRHRQLTFAPATSSFATPHASCAPACLDAAIRVRRPRSCCSSALGDARYEAMVSPGRKAAAGSHCARRERARRADSRSDRATHSRRRARHASVGRRRDRAATGTSRSHHTSSATMSQRCGAVSDRVRERDTAPSPHPRQGFISPTRSSCARHAGCDHGRRACCTSAPARSSPSRSMIRQIT